MKSVAIVTMSDSNFFELLMELINSITSFKESQNIAICVLDAGLKNDEFIIRSQKSGRTGYETQTVIEIEKKSV